MQSSNKPQNLEVRIEKRKKVYLPHEDTEEQHALFKTKWAQLSKGWELQNGFKWACDKLTVLSMGEENLCLQ